MLHNMYGHVGRMRKDIAASVERAKRDKGHIIVDAAAAVDEKYRNFLMNNTGANLTMPEEAPQNIVAKVRNKAIQALTSEPAQRFRQALAIDPAGENVDRTQAIYSATARYGIPMTAGGAALLGIMSMYGGGGDSQAVGEIPMSEEEKRKKEQENLMGMAMLATAGAGAGGTAVYAGTNMFGDDDDIGGYGFRRPMRSGK